MESTDLNFERPRRITIAIKLLYLNLGIGILRSFLEAARLTSSAPAPIGFIVVIQIVTLAIIMFLIYIIGKGKNWARIIILVLFLIGLPFSIRPLLQSLAANLFSGLLGIAQTILQIIALIFLFQKASSDWFKKAKTIARQGNPADAA